MLEARFSNQQQLNTDMRAEIEAIQKILHTDLSDQGLTVDRQELATTE